MVKWLKISVVALALLAATFVLPQSSRNSSFLTAFVGTGEVQAQEANKKKRRSLFRILFGRKKAKQEVVKRKRRTTRAKSRRTKSRKRTARSKKRNRSRRSASSSRAKLPAAIPEKLADAQKVLVIGDFFAGGLADGLQIGLADTANVVVVDRTKGLSGFIRNDIIDWPKAVAGLVEEVKPAYIVNLLGSNDRQLLIENGKSLKRRTPEWDSIYLSRVNALGAALKATGIPYSWVGLPPVRFKTMNQDYLFFNESFGKAAASQTGQFVDVWDGFSDADGNYTRSGPDVQGQITLLRSKDGINLTKAGRRRLSFYVEAAVRKALDGQPSSASLASAFDVESEAQPEKQTYDPAKTGRTIVVRLNDPSADGDAVLAGDLAAPKPVAAVVVPAPVSSANPVSGSRYGRVDNYVWPPEPDVAQQPTAVATN